MSEGLSIRFIRGYDERSDTWTNRVTGEALMPEQWRKFLDTHARKSSVSRHLRLYGYHAPDIGPDVPGGGAV